MGGLNGGRLTGAEVARVAEEIANLAGSNMPLASGLEASAEEMPGRRLRKPLQEISAAIAAGESLEAAVAAQGDRLPAHLRGLVNIGAKTGKLNQVLSRLVAVASIGKELRREMWIALAYPLISLLFAAAVLTFVCSSLIGNFGAIFRDFGVPVPRVTLLLLGIGRLFEADWTVYLEVLFGLVVFVLFFSLVLSEGSRRSMLGSIPVLGWVWRNLSLAEFCHLLSLLVESEVPLPEAIRLTGEGVQDDSAKRAAQLMARDIEGGITFAQAIPRQRFFPTSLARVFNWADGHQSLPESLRMLGEMFEARARAQAGFAGSVLGVLTVIAILFGVALVVVGLFLPLITLISKLSG